MMTLLIVAVLSIALQQPVNVVTYDAFMQQDNQGRIHTFNQMTPENRAEVVRTHIQRWLDANRSRLTTEQITVMDENIAFVTPGVYALPKTADTIARLKALEKKTKTLFTPEEMFQGLTIQGDYIPPKD